ncbi:liver-expressed antimicrobial peptide 2-like [Lampris incognitus]|uniref:liver-expressed antimicrobial peptide 2-like n=1 Tax=Lampris incognitus TaxID=2546036 RepID=UPI0024B5F997|nr:liver-expressed antimicrobial peptide 2-like [Lampris incognitus]
MRMTMHKIMVVSTLFCLICNFQAESVPVPEEWLGLIHRTKRSLLWRWNTLKPVGASCKQDSDCGTKYCREGYCSFRLSST